MPIVISVSAFTPRATAFRRIFSGILFFLVFLCCSGAGYCIVFQVFDNNSYRRGWLGIYSTFIFQQFSLFIYPAADYLVCSAMVNWSERHPADTNMSILHDYNTFDKLYGKQLKAAVEAASGPPQMASGNEDTVVHDTSPRTRKKPGSKKKKSSKRNVDGGDMRMGNNGSYIQLPDV